MRKLLIALCLAGLAFLSSPIASAHGEIVSTFPEQYTNATPIPTQVWIEFDGNLQTLDGQAINTIDVVDSTGLTVSYGDPIIEGGKISTKLSGQSAPGVLPSIIELFLKMVIPLKEVIPLMLLRTSQMMRQ